MILVKKDGTEVSLDEAAVSVQVIDLLNINLSIFEFDLVENQIKKLICMYKIVLKLNDINNIKLVNIFSRFEKLKAMDGKMTVPEILEFVFNPKRKLNKLR